MSYKDFVITEARRGVQKSLVGQVIQKYLEKSKEDGIQYFISFRGKEREEPELRGIENHAYKNFKATGYGTTPLGVYAYPITDQLIEKYLKKSGEFQMFMTSKDSSTSYLVGKILPSAKVLDVNEDNPEVYKKMLYQIVARYTSGGIFTVPKSWAWKKEFTSYLDMTEGGPVKINLKKCIDEFLSEHTPTYRTICDLLGNLFETNDFYQKKITVPTRLTQIFLQSGYDIIMDDGRKEGLIHWNEPIQMCILKNNSVEWISGERNAQPTTNHDILSSISKTPKTLKQYAIILQQLSRRETIELNSDMVGSFIGKVNQNSMLTDKTVDEFLKFIDGQLHRENPTYAFKLKVLFFNNIANSYYPNQRAVFVDKSKLSNDESLRELIDFHAPGAYDITPNGNNLLFLYTIESIGRDRFFGYMNKFLNDFRDRFDELDGVVHRESFVRCIHRICNIYKCDSEGYEILTPVKNKLIRAASKTEKDKIFISKDVLMCMISPEEPDLIELCVKMGQEAIDDLYIT